MLQRFLAVDEQRVHLDPVVVVDVGEAIADDVVEEGEAEEAAPDPVRGVELAAVVKVHDEVAGGALGVERRLLGPRRTRRSCGTPGRARKPGTPAGWRTRST